MAVWLNGSDSINGERDIAITWRSQVRTAQILRRVDRAYPMLSQCQTQAINNTASSVCLSIHYTFESLDVSTKLNTTQIFRAI
jgi:hypothetical protein